jgi:hypothetical protein
LRRINERLLGPLLVDYLWQPWSVGLMEATALPAACVGFKKKHRAVFRRASRCFVGYKKHTLRLWLHHYSVGVQLVPLISWVTPAHVSEGGLLVPSLQHCHQHWDWCPPLVVADMGGIWGRPPNSGAASNGA